AALENGGRAFSLQAARPYAAYPVASAGEAVAGADVVCTATRATAALFEAGELAPTAHVNAVGAYRHDMCEIPVGSFAGAGVIAVDDVESALAEAGDLVAALEAGAISTGRLVTIAELLAAQAAGGARRPDGATIFKSVGVAAQDWAIAELIVRREQDGGSGVGGS
ncbi:MAG TPA: hypothetical protein VMD59_12930, partial [Acidimicrobiales bacterium]|nr:hypothetical protein [Acidimicrobiales bacterium]